MTCSASPRCSIRIRRTWIPSGPRPPARCFLGIALYLFETPSLPATIGEVLRQGMASRR